jgi:signal transduction histidine kinase
VIVLASVSGVVPAGVAIVIAWAVAACYLAFVARERPLAAISAAVAVVGGIALLAWPDGGWVAGALLGLLGGLFVHLLASLPDGRIAPRRRVATIVAWYVFGAAGGAIATAGDEGASWGVLAGVWIASALCGLHLSHRRYVAAKALGRRRMQWVGWALLVWAEVALVLVALRLMSGWPDPALAVALVATVTLPAAIVAGTFANATARVDRLLVQTVSLAGLTMLVIGAYIAVVVALDRGVRRSERPLLVLSMVAAVVAALVYPLVRERLVDVTNQIVYGERTSPDESLRTWASRLTRAIPLDELLLQLVESMRKSMGLRAAEIFTGHDGHYELAAGVPHREAPPLLVGEKERTVVARAGVSGGTWLEVWLPQLADATVTTRVAPIVHAGQLLGMIVVTKALEAEPLDENDDQVLTELARQVGLALHNIQLDSALQASLDELQRTNVALQESRLRIVSAGDAERRKLERNLHDGAQQHLVAMAVKLRMAEELVEDDPPAAVRAIEDLRQALKDTIVELRGLAHGIFPPLLSSGGLAEALPASAGRSALLTTVDAAGIGRFSPEIESTVYFCCLEAMQNAAKHAGDDAEVSIWVAEEGDRLVFEVRDDGAGFDADVVGTNGHGFLNMQDRLGAVGGGLQVDSSPGKGTTIRGEIPVGSPACSLPSA